jgi:ribosomal protein S18 acetylase RimI-like enzyme
LGPFAGPESARIIAFAIVSGATAMIRPTTPADTDRLVALTAATAVFKPHEIAVLREVLDDYHRGNHEYGHLAVTAEQDGEVVGFAYYAPDTMTDRTWFLYWIAVDPSLQGRGVGRELLVRAEADIAGRRGRMLLIETSSTPIYEPTRQFYLKNGYKITSVLPDYYCDGDDRVVFGKRFE